MHAPLERASARTLFPVRAVDGVAASRQYWKTVGAAGITAVRPAPRDQTAPLAVGGSGALLVAEVLDDALDVLVLLDELQRAHRPDALDAGA
eukprot:3626497-Pyramimonas_sp.AAC.1